ncbi:class I adenylate-forming enzyme family protein [Mycobacterium sp.]|uniref:class I adenylate-forming enzyme family protein n=1 Tax=Mycobacterium sp. TaxID=1785 RepID=UPI002CCE0EC5|nr:AMP-binding protein [Mycobacterium sp.]HXB89319.1 AMP-binding protein [Mycobacterium sp.]
MSAQFDRPRPLPEALIAGWEASGAWSRLTVSEAIRQPSRAAGLACAVDTQHYSFAMLAQWSAGVCATLHGWGVRPGDRVLIQLPNGAELITAILASWHLGAVAVPVLPLLREPELAAVAQQTQPTAVIAGPGSSKRVPTAEIDSALAAASVRPLIRLGVAHRTAGWMPFPVSGSAQEQSPQPHPGFANADACALILFTSGTTAQPKGVRHDSRSLLAEVNSYRRSAELTTGDVIFNPAPIAHVGALVISVLVPWCVGAPVVLLSKWDSQRAREAITRERVTFAVGAPYFLNELVALYESSDFCGHRLSKFQTGAAPTGSALLARADRVGIAAWRAWGMTEAPTISYATAGDPLDRRANFDGRVEPESQVVAVDEAGVALPAGREGHLLLRSPKQMMGYVRDVDATRHPGGWLATGDVGMVDCDGWVRITGRIKDIINRGGEKFSAREIENALCDHPAIEAAAVLGVPEQRLGEQVVAYVTTRPGQCYPGLSAIIDYLQRRRMAPQKYPVAITVLEALPMTATGKVHKHALAQLWENSQLTAR